VAKTLQQILGYVPLTGLINRIKTGIPDNLPPAFRSVKKRVKGNAGRYTRRVGVRQTARRTEYGAPSINRELRPVESIDVVLRNTVENIVINPILFQALRGYTNYEMDQDLAMEELDNQIADFATFFNNLELAELYSMLANGALYYDVNGNLLPSSSGARVTAGYGISANNQGHANGIVTASWANLNTDIPLQIRNLRLRAAQLTGYDLKYAFYGLNIPSYMTQNNFILDYLARHDSMRDHWLQTAEIPKGLFGLTWVPVYTSFYADQTGTNQTFFGADQCIFTPEIDREVFESIEGSTPVPTAFNIYSDMMGALSSAKLVFGRYSYSVPSFDPLTAKVFMGDLRLPAWKVPDAIFQLTVNP
jgi:hypothetical protein